MMTIDTITAMIPRDRQTRRWNIRTCSICSEPIGYVFACNAEGDPVVAFDSNCGCTTWWYEPERRSVLQVEAFLARQTQEIRERLEGELTKVLNG